ncbi:MAG: D-TA family PLP-dependent enzyme [Anaerolineae bacterium]|nr:D-TA family PLP-dependent enzyme [Anaerolineales bacterium]MCQ3972790.1 D-TA family PLP-dependent enzyme [Anaerolineae bacterium]
MRIEELDTPAAIVELDRLEANISRFQRYLDEHGIANRPHIKTHKIPEIAHMQLRAGAVGITCQKIGEAEVMAQAGIGDIFLPYNIIGERKLERLMRLAHRVNLSMTADSEFTLRGLAAAAQREGLELETLVEFDSGLGRCGVQTPQEAADLARLIARSPGLRFGGLMTYPSNQNTDPFVAAARSLLAGDGLVIERVSGGSTPGMWQAHTHPEVNEHRAGMYIYGDRYTIKNGAMKLEECSFKVITTVVSRPTADRGILDGGSKTFSSDLLGLEGYGLILEYPEAVIYGQSEEHGHVDFSQCARKPEIGERVTVVPNHCCVVSNLFNQVAGVRDGKVEVIWPVAARGALQ